MKAYNCWCGAVTWTAFVVSIAGPLQRVSEARTAIGDAVAAAPVALKMRCYRVHIANVRRGYYHRRDVSNLDLPPDASVPFVSPLEYWPYGPKIGGDELAGDFYR